MKKVKIDLGNFYKGGFISFLTKIDDDTYKAELPFMTCRSYMVDALFQMKNPKYPSALRYKFEYDYTKGDTYIGLYGTATDFVKNIKWLHDFEEKAKVKKSEVIYTTDPSVIIVKGSKFWKDSCWKLALYTYLLKCTPHRNLALQYPSVVPYIDQLLKKIKVKKELFDWSVYGSGVIYGRHNLEGFNSICSGANKPMARFLGLTGRAIGEV